ncbi:MAG: hypothetical protein Q4A32_10655 [Lachnospiraceae bacterium]|nr:hypothetical protein [Lachnospiraceae bacterium]
MRSRFPGRRPVGIPTPSGTWDHPLMAPGKWKEKVMAAMEKEGIMATDS